MSEIAFVIGANDVANPAAKNDPFRRSTACQSSIASGYTGVENELFYRDNTIMLFGDTKKCTRNRQGAGVRRPSRY